MSILFVKYLPNEIKFLIMKYSYSIQKKDLLDDIKHVNISKKIVELENLRKKGALMPV